MKNRYLFLLAATCLLATATQAQPILLASQHIPEYADSALRQFYQPSPVLPGAAGAGVTWDFSQLVPIARSDSAEFEYFPYPNLNNHNHNRQLRFFSEVDVPYQQFLVGDDSIAYAGYNYNGPAPILSEYSDPELLLRFPLMYGDQVNDTFVGNYRYYGYANQYPGNVGFSGSSTSIADAYGTLLLPGGFTYVNVMRIHRQGTFTDSTGTRNYATWSFYTSTKVFPILVIGDNTPFEGSYVHITDTRKGNPPRAISEPGIQKGIDLLGNPVTELLRVHVHEPGLLQVLGTDGRLIFQGQIDNFDTVLDIPMAAVSPGVYLVRLQGRAETYTLKCIKFSND